MRSRTTKAFRALLAALSPPVRRQARADFRLFRQNSAHPILHFKRVIDVPPTFSARVGLHHRAMAIVDGGEAIWFWIGTHAEYDKRLKGV